MSIEIEIYHLIKSKGLNIYVTVLHTLHENFTINIIEWIRTEFNFSMWNELQIQIKLLLLKIRIVGQQSKTSFILGPKSLSAFDLNTHSTSSKTIPVRQQMIRINPAKG